MLYSQNYLEESYLEWSIGTFTRYLYTYKPIHPLPL